MLRSAWNCGWKRPAEELNKVSNAIKAEILRRRSCAGAETIWKKNLHLVP